MAQLINPQDYRRFLDEIREIIRQKQLEAYRKANKTMVELYWQLGQKIVENLEKFRWGKSVVNTLSQDLQQDFPGVRGFSVQNMWYMRKFYLAYAQSQRILPLIGDVGWTHHVVILDKTQDDSEEYAKKMNVSIATASRDLKDLVNKDYAQKTGKRRNVSYLITKTVEV